MTTEERTALERLRYERVITRSSVKTKQAVVLNRLVDKGLAVFIDEAWAITPRGATAWQHTTTR